MKRSSKNNKFVLLEEIAFGLGHIMHKKSRWTVCMLFLIGFSLIPSVTNSLLLSLIFIEIIIFLSLQHSCKYIANIQKISKKFNSSSLMEYIYLYKLRLLLSIIAFCLSLFIIPFLMLGGLINIHGIPIQTWILFLFILLLYGIGNFIEIKYTQQLYIFIVSTFLERNIIRYSKGHQLICNGIHNLREASFLMVIPGLNLIGIYLINAGLQDLSVGLLAYTHKSLKKSSSLNNSQEIYSQIEKTSSQSNENNRNMHNFSEDHCCQCCGNIIRDNDANYCEICGSLL